MKKIILKINNLNSFIEKKQIIKDLNLIVRESETHIIMGPNGSGKSSLLKILAGHPCYKVRNSSIVFCNNNLLNLNPENRSHEGLFMGFQYPIEISGLTNFEFLRIAFNEKQNYFKKKNLSPIEFIRLIKPFLLKLDIKNEFLSRDLNFGFSGGEKKRNEILQMILLKPKLIVLDEIDSGLDMDTMQLISDLLKDNIEKNSSLIVISHYPSFIEYLKPTFVHIMLNGSIIKTGKLELLNLIKEKGFRQFKI